MYSLGYAKAANTPAISDVMQEIAARQKNLLVGYVVSGCTHGVSASKVAPAFACKGYMKIVQGRLVGLGLLRSDDPIKLDL